MMSVSVVVCFFFFSSRRGHTRLQGDWSSDVCSSDLCPRRQVNHARERALREQNKSRRMKRPVCVQAVEVKWGHSEAPLRLVSPSCMARKQLGRVVAQCHGRRLGPLTLELTELRGSLFPVPSLRLNPGCGGLRHRPCSDPRKVTRVVITGCWRFVFATSIADISAGISLVLGRKFVDWLPVASPVAGSSVVW